MADTLKLTDTATKFDLLKVILGYLSSITVSTQEEIVNDFLDKIFIAKTIHKEQKPETNFAIKSEASTVKPSLTDM